MKDFTLTEKDFIERGWKAVSYDLPAGPQPPLAFVIHLHPGHKFELFYRGNSVFDVRELTYRDVIPQDIPVSDIKWTSLDYKIPMNTPEDLDTIMRIMGIPVPGGAPIYGSRKTTYESYKPQNPYGPEQVIMEAMKEELMKYLGVKPMIIGISKTMPGAGFRYALDFLGSGLDQAGWSEAKKKAFLDELNKSNDINKDASLNVDTSKDPFREGVLHAMLHRWIPALLSALLSADEDTIRTYDTSQNRFHAITSRASGRYATITVGDTKYAIIEYPANCQISIKYADSPNQESK